MAAQYHHTGSRADLAKVWQAVGVNVTKTESGQVFHTALTILIDRQGMLEIQIKDHRDAIGDFSKLNITIEKLLISPKPGLKFWRTGWHELKAIPNTVDLTRYAGGTGVRIYRGAIDAGDSMPSI